MAKSKGRLLNHGVRGDGELPVSKWNLAQDAALDSGGLPRVVAKVRYLIRNNKKN
jgi:hypothetical protein